MVKPPLRGSKFALRTNGRAVMVKPPLRGFKLRFAQREGRACRGRRANGRDKRVPPVILPAQRHLKPRSGDLTI